MTLMNMKNRIMLSVYLEFFMRKLNNPFISESLIFITLAVILSIFVSVPSVISNMFISGNYYRYFIMAFSGTDLLVQMILVLTGFMILFFIKNITFRAMLRERFV
ncbi:MAG: hypothetical protein A2544_01550 [Candidatus Zambryskibacteria bacterium RIFOXYD2_FULL_43_10]|uniref:Uncharacterized protein n=1 Tax=Candidatus Zambryskibacteria bacterium RIFOXYD2_FULL_43_10 TaxID=1802782 RepID=A0A1G2V6W0_9BACT|nr:MAG: hypothetical protein A2544_01550 [Candidatus Zambryskibacteria bacterium RIFOXYD2_FULL_43_10]